MNDKLFLKQMAERRLKFKMEIENKDDIDLQEIEILKNYIKSQNTSGEKVLNNDF